MKPSVIFKKLHDYLTDKDYRVIFNSHRGFYNKMDDKEYLKLMYRTMMHKELNIENPQTFTEKLQWLKLYNHKPVHTIMADKFHMRDFVKEKIGEGHTVPLLGIYDKWKTIDFTKLPNSFVIKTTHDSGSYVICKDKNKLDKASAKKKINASLRHNYYNYYREWQYKNVKPQIIIEEFLDDGQSNLTDYKFFCFNGKCVYLYIQQETAKIAQQVILDPDFHRMPFTMEDPPTKEIPSRPKNFEQMLEYAEKISKEEPFLRVDMYLVNSKIYVGELTFYHLSGYIPIDPPEWDFKLGQILTLPSQKD